MPSAKWNWGVPDWRDPAAYPRSDDLDVYGWRWQFLRRREDYRADWVRHAFPTYQRAVAYLEHLKRIGHDLLLKSYQGGPLPVDHPDFRASMPGAPEKYGLFNLPNPADLKPFPISWASSFGSMVEGQGDGWLGEPIDFNLSAGKVAVTFDLRKPLRPQIEHAETFLQETQEFRIGSRLSRRQHRSKWPMYLRVLDARDAGATWQAIGQCVLRYHRDEPQAAMQVYDQARSLMFNFPP